MTVVFIAVAGWIVGIGAGLWVFIELRAAEREWRMLVRGYLEHLTQQPLPGVLPTETTDIPPIGFPVDDDVPGFRRRPFQPPVRIDDETDLDASE